MARLPYQAEVDLFSKTACRKLSSVYTRAANLPESYHFVMTLDITFNNVECVRNKLVPVIIYVIAAINRGVFFFFFN